MSTSRRPSAPPPSDGEQRPTLERLEAHLPAARESVPPPSGAFVGTVVDDRHPNLTGRVRVRWIDAHGVERERWVPTLHALAIRVHDRVLVQSADNFEEPIAVGVLDGFARRPEVPKDAAATLELKSDEVVRIADASGAPLFEVCSSDAGPVVKLLSEDVNLEVPGKFTVNAKSIKLRAEIGEARIEAHDDVIVVGENVKIN